jgi:sulfotransferase family protein
MAVTPRHGARTQPPPPPSGLGFGQMVRLGALGLASDVRDRGRDPALRKRPTAHALDPRLHRPIFIIGAPRSGTTFLGGCLGRMPEVSYHFEPRLTKAAARCVYDGSWSERRCATVFRLSYSALLLAGLHGGRRFAEKNPENSFVVPFLAETMPEAQFIHIIRDGRDAAVSHAEQPWLNAKSAGSGQRGRGGQLWGNAARWWVEPDRRDEFAAVTDIVRSAWCWRRFTEAALAGLATLSAGRSIEVRYESVVSDPMNAADLLSGFLGTTPAGLDALRAGLAGARPDSVGRWRKTLDERQVNDVQRETRPLLARLGYT